ncbi:MAG: hypothetical protein ABSD56_07070 [Bryobacteraceae bacterium]
MLVESRLTLSKRFAPGVAQVQFAQYSLRAVPTPLVSEAEAILSFENTYEAPAGGGSNPEGEAEAVCRLLGLLLDARVRKVASRIADIDLTVPTGASNAYPQFSGRLDSKGLDDSFARVLSLGDDLSRQFARACRCYTFALEFIPSDPTFAFFLLVVAAECMSSQDSVISFVELHPENKKCERFCCFVKRFLPEECKSEDDRNEPLLTELLKTAYYSHRSGFAHGGKEVSSAALIADQAKLNYFKHVTDGREEKTPGLAWFANIVRGALLGYLGSLPPESVRPDKDRLARLAFEKCILKITSTVDAVRGQVCTLDNIEYR